MRRSLLNQGRLSHADPAGQKNGHTAVTPGEEGKAGRRGQGNGFSRLSHHPLWHGPMLCAEGAGAMIRHVQQAEEGEVSKDMREGGTVEAFSSGPMPSFIQSQRILRLTSSRVGVVSGGGRG